MTNCTFTNQVESPVCLAILSFHVPHFHSVIFIAIISILCPITIVSNILLIYSLYKTQQNGNISVRLMILMTLSDSCIGFIILPLFLTNLFENKKNQSCFKVCIVQFSGLLFAYFSFIMFFVVAGDHYFRMTILNRYNSFMSNNKLIVVAIANPVANTLLSSLLAFSITVFPSFSYQLFVNLINIIIMICIYCLYSSAVKNVQHRCSTSTQNFSNARKHLGRERYDVTLARAIRILVTIMFFAYLPYNIMTLISVYYKFELQYDTGMNLDIGLFWSCLLVCCNSSVNAVVYSYTNKRVKMFIERIFCRLRRNVVEVK